MAFDPESDIVIINDPGPFAAKAVERGNKTRKRARVSIEVESEPLLFDLNATQLGAKPAQAIKEILAQQVRVINATASPSTIKRRQSAEKNRDTTEYRKNYSGGRMGEMPPTGSTRLFNDSGRLAEGLYIRQNTTDKSFTINVPVNRFSPSMLGERLQPMLSRFISLMPALRDIRSLLNDKRFTDAVDESIQDAIVKGQMQKESNIKALWQARVAAARVVLSLIREVAAP